MAELNVKQDGKVVNGVKVVEMKYVAVEHSTGAFGKGVDVDATEVDVDDEMGGEIIKPKVEL